MYPGTHADRTPAKAAVVVAETGRVVTYAELDERSTRLADVLARQGLRRGDHIAFVADNTPEVFEVYWAALRSGLYVTGVNNHLTPAEAAYVVADCGATVLLASAGAGDLARDTARLCPDLTLRLAWGGPVEGFDDYGTALAAASAQRPAHEPAGTDMLYSSGTTGRPKGVLPKLPTHRIDEPGDVFTAVFAPIYGFDPETVYYSAAPLYHAAPLRFSGMVHRTGGTVVLAARFDAEEALAAIGRYRVTHSQWVPTMFVRMLKLPAEVRERADVSSLRVAIHAAAPCPVEVKQQMIDWWGPVLHEYYSSTEGNGVTMISPQDWLAHPGSVGRAALGVLHICDDEGAELPTGEIGTVWVEREEMPFAYHGDPAATAAAQHPEHPNWSAIGDVGRVDEDGYLYLTDRKAFMIISGGVNVYPQEAEDVLVMHPAVADVAVIGVPDEDLGESVLGVVQVVDGVSPSADLAADLIGFGRERLAGYKVPRRIEFVDELPRSATGKLVKRRLTEVYR